MVRRLLETFAAVAVLVPVAAQSAHGGGPGLYVGLPGEPRTVGVTLRVALRPRN